MSEVQQVQQVTKSKLDTLEKVTLKDITDYIDDLYDKYDIKMLEESFKKLIAESNYKYTKYSVESSGRTFECRLFDTQEPVHVIRQFAVLQDFMFGDMGAEEKPDNKDLLDDFLEICFLATTEKEGGKVKKDEASFELVHDAWAIAKILDIGNKDITNSTPIDDSITSDIIDQLFNTKDKQIYNLQYNGKKISLEGRHLKVMVAYENLPPTEQKKDTVQISVYNHYIDFITKMLNKFPSPFKNSTPITGGNPVKKSKKTKKTKNPTRRI